MDECVDDDPIRDPGAVASKWVSIDHRWDQRGELAPEGVDNQ